MRRLVLLCALLSACVPSLHGGAREPQLSMPASYGDEAPASGRAAADTWRQVFDDPHLVALIDEALAHNQELAILEREIAVANAEVMARRGEVLPQVGATAGAGVEKVGEYTSQGAGDAVHEIAPGTEVPDPLGDLHFGLEASWEVDVWKKLRNQAKAARYRYLSSIEGRNFMVTVLVAEIAKSYYELLALDNQLLVLQNNIQLLQDSVEIVKLQKEAARVTELGVQRFEAELLANQAREFEIRQRIVETENHLNFLCGRFPQSVPRSSETFADVSPSPIAAGLPTELLENRPDVRAAELELEAAKLDVKAARAAFYPSVSIDAEVGLEAFAASRLLTTPESLAYGVAAELFEPLLNRKVLKAGLLAADSKQMQAVLRYEQTVLNGYVEAANQIARVRNLDQSYERQAQQVERLQDAIETATGLFRSARADYLEVLTTRRDALESQMELFETRQRRMSAMVDVYQALGGGWRVPEARE